MQARGIKANAAHWVSIVSVAWLGPWLASCGGNHAPSDAGPKDASASDGAIGARGDGGSAFIRRRDAQVTSGDPLPMCSRFDPMPCGAGQQCRLVIRRAADAGGFLIYPACVEGAAGRPFGAPCDPWGGQANPYTAQGLEDEVYVDPCAQDLYCAPDPKIRGHFSCQRSCESGRLQGQTQVVSCPKATQYCGRSSSMATSLEEVCHDSDICDPSDPTSCGPGKACYLRPNDGATGVLTVCLPVSTMPVADGEMCQYLNDCNPGSSCWGPTRLPRNRWMPADLICRHSCQVSPTGGISGADAGDEDAGPGGSTRGGCPKGTACASFAGSGLDQSSVTVPLAQCE